MAFDIHTRARVIYLRFELGVSARDIATRLIISHTSVKRFIRDYVAYGTLETPSRGQRVRTGIIPHEHMNFLEFFFLKQNILQNTQKPENSTEPSTMVQWYSCTWNCM